MRLMASARGMLGRRFDYPLLRAHDNFVSTLSDYVRLSVKGKCPLSRLPC